MSTSAISMQESMSLSVTSGSLLSTSAGSERNPQNSGNNTSDSSSSESSLSVFSDKFEFSSSTDFSNLTYTPSVFQRSRTSNLKEDTSLINLPKSREELDKLSDQTLTDYFGIDTDKRGRYRSALDDLETIDPELAEKALFLITLLGKDEADKFLADITDFTSRMNQSQSSDFSMNIVASSMTTTLNDVYEGIRSDAREALEQYSEIISEKFNIEINIQTTSLNLDGFCDPLVLDIDGDGIDLSSVEDGVEFDIDGDGNKEQTSFIRGDDALLYLDNNGNGVADSGLELFGDQEGDKNGYEELAKYDENNDGKIDNLDKIYSQLRLWQDKNSDGENQESESMTLLEAGIQSIQLKYNQIMQQDSSGSITGQSGEFTRIDGTKGYSADMLLKTQRLPSGVKELLEIYN